MSIFSNYQPLHFITVNEENALNLSILAQNIEGVLWLPDKLKNERICAQYYSGSLARHLEKIWSESQAIIFLSDSGGGCTFNFPFTKR